jgi:hypothetical protein
MIIYAASVYTIGLHAYTLDSAYIHRSAWKRNYKSVPILESYHYIKNEQILESIAKNKDSIFLDSGAFTMFTQGVKVDLRAYANFINKYRKLFHVASNLGIIGRGKEKENYQNQKILESYGATVSPVHHARDRDKWLVKYLEEGYDYVFLGGMVPETTQYLEKWLDRIWDLYLTDKNGLPLVKVHGFGLITERLMRRYPWYSVDSTSWLALATKGDIMILIDCKDSFLKAVSFSNQSPNRKKAGAHISTLSKQEAKLINNLVKKRGFKPKHLRNSITHRRLFNLLTYREMQHTVKWPKTFINTHRGLFHEESI